MRQWWPIPAVLVGAVALVLAFGPGYAGYDASWTLVWGADVARGELPDYDAPVAPTPHPLANAVAAIASPLPDGGEAAIVWLTFLSFAALVAGVVALASRLMAWPAGVVAGTLVATTGLLAREAAFASLDIPFLAFAVWAGALAARQPRRDLTVLALLGLAGLLRPEAWLLSILYVSWMVRAGARGQALRAAALLAIAAPVLWAASDLVVTGDALHSLSGTRDLAVELDRPTGLSTALHAVPSSLARVVGPLVLVAGVLGLAAGLVLARRRMAIAGVALGAGIATFLAIGIAGLPVLVRYLLVPACALMLTAGLGVALPVAVASGHRRGAALAVSAVITLLLAASLPRAVEQVRDARAFTLERGRVHRDLRALVATPAFRAAAARCPKLRVPDFRTRPVLLLDGFIDPQRVVVGNLPDREPGLLLTYSNERARRIFNLGAPGEARLQALPSDGRVVSRNGSWVADAVC